MNKESLKAFIKVGAQVIYVGAGIYMLFSVFSYFHRWDLPLWQWIGSLVVAPITFVVMPIYIGFTEGDWSLVLVWAGAIVTVVLSALVSEQ